MIISHGRRYIFVHAPTTGGASITLELGARAKANDIVIGDTPKAKQRRERLADLTPAVRLWQHSTLGDFDGIVDASAVQDYRQYRTPDLRDQVARISEEDIARFEYAFQEIENQNRPYGRILQHHPEGWRFFERFIWYS